ncbi:MAG: hypothetical protein M3Y56_14315 [Armatimonadota bacterium]|nr:hypothetical protein [Armatimonadota bacterium]
MDELDRIVEIARLIEPVLIRGVIHLNGNYSVLRAVPSVEVTHGVRRPAMP